MYLMFITLAPMWWDRMHTWRTAAQCAWWVGRRTDICPPMAEKQISDLERTIIDMSEREVSLTVSEIPTFVCLWRANIVGSLNNADSCVAAARILSSGLQEH